MQCESEDCTYICSENLTCARQTTQTKLCGDMLRKKSMKNVFQVAEEIELQDSGFKSRLERSAELDSNQSICMFKYLLVKAAGPVKAYLFKQGHWYRGF